MSRNPVAGYTITFNKRAQKMLQKLDHKIQKTVLQKLEELVKEHHSLDIIKLEGYANLYRISFGDCRIVYEPLHKEIIVYVLLVGHRREIYRELSK